MSDKLSREDVSVTYTLVLLPPDNVAAELIQLSETLSSRVNSDLVLGNDAPPHITIAQWQNADLDLLKHQTSHFAEIEPGPLTFAGMSVVRGPDEDNWIEIPILSTAKLRMIQDHAVEVTSKNGHIVNGVGDRFRPHVTVGFTYKSELWLPLLSSVFLRTTHEGWKPCLGISGTNFVFTQAIEWD